MRKVSDDVYTCDSCSDGYDDYEDVDSEECLSVFDAANIWVSNGEDEDYMFGYSEEELRKAL